jgi:hypothetical protein
MIPGAVSAAILAVSFAGSGCGQISLVGLDAAAPPSNSGGDREGAADAGGAGVTDGALAKRGKGSATPDASTGEAGCAVCALRLVEGHLVDTAVSSSASGLRLLGPGFEAPSPICTTVDERRICLIGGIEP